MSEVTLLDQAKELKKEGNDFGKIRTILQGSGYNDDEITSAFKTLDEDEIQDLFLGQKIKTARTKLIVTLVLTIAIVAYNLYRFGLEDEIDFLLLLIPMAIFIASYFSFKSIKSKNKVSL